MTTNEDIKQYVETRLLAFDPNIDLSDGSPAQSAIIGPIVERFGNDPFSVDTLSFIRQVVSESYPDLGLEGGGVVEDIFNGLSLILEPLRRTIEEIRVGQSVVNADLMSDEQADALADNYFISRRQGNRAQGRVRLYFSAPSTQRVSVDNRVYTAKGLSFYPIGGYSITQSQMLFNRSGSLYFMDIVVEAETEGRGYNVEVGDIVGIEGVPAVVKVANLSAFQDGDERQSSQDLLSSIPSKLSERSLATARGVTAKLDEMFGGDIRGVQVVGAGDPGMQRDVLKGSGEGRLIIAGTGRVYGEWLLTSSIVYKDDGAAGISQVEVGDLLRFHPSADTSSSITGITETYEAVILAIYPYSNSDPRPLLVLNKSLVVSSPEYGRFAVFKKPVLTISEVPGGISSGGVVPDNAVHIGGHVDVFVRPSDDSEESAQFKVSDDSPIAIVTDLQIVLDAPEPSISGLLYSAISDFNDLGVTPYDCVVEVETEGDFSGSFQIIEVGNPSPNHLRVKHIFPRRTVTTPSVETLRARIMRSPKMDLVAPKLRKYPASESYAIGLQLLVNSPVFKCPVDLATYGVTDNDVIQILSGDAAGTYTIKGFDSSLAGFGPIVDRVAPISDANLPFVVYTPGTGVNLPLVRVQKISVIDQTGQDTGVVVPYGLPVDARPVNNLSGAGESEIIYDKDLLLFPDASSFLPDIASDYAGFPDITPANKQDARYSQNLVSWNPEEFYVRRLSGAQGPNSTNVVTDLEYLLPKWLWNGVNDKVMAYTTRRDPEFLADPSGNARTSIFAEMRIGDTFRILEGPNAGSYVVRDLHVYDFWKKTTAGTEAGHEKVAIARIDPPLKTNPLTTAVNIIKTSGTMTLDEFLKIFEYATSRGDANGFIEGVVIPKLTAILSALGSITSDQVRGLLSGSAVSYQAGRSARGLLRTYFVDPASVEFYAGDSPTIFRSGAGDRRLRIDPGLPPAQILPEANPYSPPTEWLRNIETAGANSDFISTSSGPTVIEMGVRPNDIIEFHRAINECPAKRLMQSSFICTTKAGSPDIAVFLPAPGELGNYAAIEEGQIIFLDSGPDAGGYRITKVLETYAAPAYSAFFVKVRLDRPLSFTTDQSMPFIFMAGSVPAMLYSTSDLTFPLTITSKKLSLQVSHDYGQTWTYGQNLSGNTAFANLNGTFASIGALVTALNADSNFNSSLTGASPSASFAAYANGNRLVIRLNVAGGLVNPVYQIRLKPVDHTATELSLTTQAVARRGATCKSNGKRIYGTLLNTFGAEGKYVHLYAARGTDIIGVSLTHVSDDRPYLGSFKILSEGMESTGMYQGISYLELERSANFPTLTVEDVSILWAITDAPLTPPFNTTGGGKELSSQFVRFRMYDEVSERTRVDSYPEGNAPHPLLEYSPYQTTTAGPTWVKLGEIGYGFKNPYRVLRPGVYRRSSTSMQSSRDGALYYTDVPVVGFGPDDSMNVTSDEPFAIDGNYSIEGYTLETINTSFTYSDKEQVFVKLPAQILPAGFMAGSGKEVVLPKKSVRVQYNWAPTVNDVQQLLSSPLERPQAANLLARHFLPAYVIVDGTYTGGSDVDVVAEDIINYILSIPADAPRIQVDDLIELIRRRQGRVPAPFQILALVHGADRVVATLRSSGFIGSGMVPNFDGTFSQIVFIPGADTSRLDPRPNGEQTFLRKV